MSPPLGGFGFFTNVGWTDYLQYRRQTLHPPLRIAPAEIMAMLTRGSWYANNYLVRLAASDSNSLHEHKKPHSREESIVNRASDWTSLLVAAAALSLLPAAAVAQNEAPTKRSGVEYVRVVYVDYKLDKRNEARGIIDDHFIPASKTAGTPGPMMTLHFQTGEWDSVFVWAMKDGMTELEWTQITPNFVKWKAALDAQVGGEEQGWEVMNRYNAAIARRRTEVGHYHIDGT